MLLEGIFAAVTTPFYPDERIYFRKLEANMARYSLRGPGFFTTGASLVKNARLSERVTLQLRAECFNIFNHLNLANPSGTHTSSTFMESTATRNSSSAPGIGPGEPFNVQFAGKFIF